MSEQTVETAEVGADQFGSLNHILTILPALMTEFCAVVLVPTATQLLLPTIEVIDKSGTDHRAEVAALRHFPQALSGVVQHIGPDYFEFLMGHHVITTGTVREAVDAAHEAALTVLESSPSNVVAVLTDMLVAGAGSLMPAETHSTEVEPPAALGTEIGVAAPGMTPADEAAALLRVEGDSGVTQPWQVGEMPEIGPPIVALDGPEMKGL